MKSFDDPNRHAVMFSSSEDSFPWAVQELRDAFGLRLALERLGPDVGVMNAPGLSVEAVRAACFNKPLAFVRHLTVERLRIPRNDATELKNAMDAALSVVDRAATGPDLAVQAWVSGPAKMAYTAGELAGSVSTALEDRGFSVARGRKSTVLSCCITRDWVSFGLNRLSDSLSDWPGGRVRLNKGAEQISRAEFKLEELFDLFPLGLPATGKAIDLGAAPGGWTRILRQRGLTVWAVDPGDLDHRLVIDRGVHHERATAGTFLRSTNMMFDVAVNDMRMDPVLSCSVMVQASKRLQPGACCVITLKLGARDPLAILAKSLDTLRKQYEVLFARQLHHNRHEVTVVARRLPSR